MAHYIIFGDSIAQGFNDLTGGWVQRLRESLTLNDYVFNLGVSGDTSEGLLARFETELKPRLSTEGEANFIMVAIGSNDSAFINQENHCWVPLGKYRENLQKIVAIAKKYTDKIILISPEPVAETVVDPIPWAPEMSYKTNIIKQYSQSMGQVAQQEKLKFVDLFSNLPAEYIKTLADGVHPDTVGHRLIFNLVKDVLK